MNSSLEGVIRYTDDPYNLNLSYVTDRIMIIGSPFHDDTLPQLRQFIQSRYTSKQYRVYNFSSEEEYNIEQDLENVITFGYLINTPCPLTMLIEVCSHICNFLNQNEHHIVILHSKYGKGRCGLIAACVLLLLHEIDSAKDAVDLINMQRGPEALTIPSQIRYVYYYEKLLRQDFKPMNTYQLVYARVHTVPKCTASIIHVGCIPYFTVHVAALPSTDYGHVAQNQGSLLPRSNLARWDVNTLLLNPSDRELYGRYDGSASSVGTMTQTMQQMSMQSGNNGSSGGIVWASKRIFSSLQSQYNNKLNEVKQYRSHYDEDMEFPLTTMTSSSSSTSHSPTTRNTPSKLLSSQQQQLQASIPPIYLRGDVCLRFYSEKEKFTQVCFHTAFVEQYYLSFEKDYLDIASEDRYHRIYEKEYGLELVLVPVDDQPMVNIYTHSTTTGGGVGGSHGNNSNQQHPMNRLMSNDPFFLGDEIVNLPGSSGGGGGEEHRDGIDSDERLANEPMIFINNQPMLYD